MNDKKKLYQDGRKFTNFTLDLVCFSNRNIHICLNVCVCGCVPYITKLYKKKIPKLKNGKQNLFMGHVMLLSMSMMIGRKKQATVRQKNIIYTIKKNLHRKKENVDKTDDLMIYMKMVVVENIF